MWRNYSTKRYQVYNYNERQGDRVRLSQRWPVYGKDRKLRLVLQITEVRKSEFKFETTEPDKNTEWQWMKWEVFRELPNLFNPFKYFFEQGFRELEDIKKHAKSLPN